MDTETKTGYRALITSGTNIFAIYKQSVSGKVSTFRSEGISQDDLFRFGIWEDQHEAFQDALEHAARYPDDIRYQSPGPSARLEDDGRMAQEIQVSVLRVTITRTVSYEVVAAL